MRRFLSVLIVLLVSVWAGVKISEDPGYALFVYREWSMEMPLWFAFLAAIIFMMMLYFILRFFDGIGLFWLRLKNWFRLRQKYKAMSKTNRGLIELLEGDWQNAEYDVLQGVARGNSFLVNYLVAAKAAHEQMAYERRDLYLEKIYDAMPEAATAIRLVQVQLQISQGQLEQPLATLVSLQQQSPKHKMVLQLLERLYIRLADWEALLLLLPALRKAKLMTPTQLDNFEAHLYQELLSRLTDTEYNLARLREIWSCIPSKIKKNQDLIACYIKKLLPMSAAVNEIEELIVGVLKKNWNEDLVAWYGQIESQDPKAQLAVAESWLKQYEYRAMLFMTLGRLCLRCQLWGKARSYIEQSIKADPVPEAYYLYGKLLEQLGETDAALTSYREGLAAVANT